MPPITPRFLKLRTAANPEQRKWHERQFFFFLLFGMCALLGPYVPFRSWNGCLVEKLLHVFCPVCEISSSIWVLIKGNLQESLALHPAGIVAFVVLVLYAGYFSCAYLLGICLSWRNEIRWKTYIDISLFGFVGIVWLFRLVY